MCARLTIENIRDRLSRINENIIILSDEYTDSLIKLKLKCVVDGYEWYANWNSLSQGRGCPKCAGRITNGISEIRDILYNINPNIEILSNKYVGIHSTLKCNCKICGNDWNASWNNLKRGSGCPNCANNIKLTIDIIKDRLFKINHNIRILSDSYINNSSKLECMCLIDGHEWSVTWRDLSQGNGCPKCNGGVVLNMEYVKERMKSINQNIEILSDVYVNSKTKLKCACLIHNIEWMVSWDKLSQGQVCPVCGVIARSKENHYRWNIELTDEQREELRDVPKNVEWRKSVFEKHNYTCEICNIKGTKLNAHHKDGYHWCKERRTDINNGACLCEDCHYLFHKIYGNKNNTEQQWLEFHELNKIT